MTDNIERMLAVPLPEGEVARLSGLEDRVWDRIQELRARRHTHRLRFAVVAVSLLIGVTNGGGLWQVFKPRPSDIQVFSVSAGLMPMARLEAGG
ncbi:MULTISPECIES: hypothetical protein [unclassified Brevundimonas]|uniref:hypothetical protein n=1 Tax=unclassified Brevundimonas TaxID=2622653 RepID=UPI0025BA3AD2|nr:MULTISPECIES: hypothetical protein [unclassified Brevundimonas]